MKPQPMDSVIGFSGIVPAETKFQKRFNRQPPTFQKSIREAIAKINEQIESTKPICSDTIIYMSEYKPIFAANKILNGELDHIYAFIKRAYELNGYLVNEIDSCSFVIGW